VTVLPTGTLTFLFTDVEGSTPLWEQHEALMRTVTARHDALLDAVITQHGGQRVRERGEGDSLFVVFTEPAAAVACALAMAQAVQAESWPAETPLRVRLGLHTGAAQMREGDYYGPVVNRCARIRGLGHGGQVLLSAVTAALVRRSLPPEASLRSLGQHSLTGLADVEEVFQLCHPTLPAEFPALVSPQAPKHNLPLQHTSLIGREAAQAAVLALLAAESLVTLTGTGGIGKTRLALAVAGEVVDQYRDGVWFVELAALVDPDLVPSTVAQVLGVRDEPGRALTLTLGDQLQERQLLVVLDNCEQVAAGCAALVTALLRVVPGLRVLATSREALRVRGERLYQVAPLRVPRPPLPALVALSQYEAVRLFIARAQDAQPDFAVTNETAPAVAEICARLDGLPLAIELVAARSRLLGPEALLARLGERLRVATGGARDLPARQQTLRAAIDWSYDLLEPAEQTLFARLAVFAGGRTLAAIEVVCDADRDLGIEVLDAVESLLDKSLLRRELGADGEQHLVLLETIHEYARERLATSGEQAGLEAAHARYYLALTEEAESHLSGARQGHWLDVLAAEHDNLRAVLRWATARGEQETGLRMAGAIWRFWLVRGYLSEGRRWLEELLAQGATQTPPAPASAVRAKALNGAGVLAFRQGDYARATVRYEESLAMRRALGDKLGIAASLNNLAIVAHGQGDYARAAAFDEESLAMRRALGDKRGIASSLANLGVVAHDQGDYVRATALYEEGLAMCRALGDKLGIARSLQNLGEVAGLRKDYARATVLLEEGLALFRELDYKRGIAASHTSLAMMAHSQGDLVRATMLFDEGLGLFRALDDMGGIAASLANLGFVARDHGDYARAATLLGDGLVLFRELGDKVGIAESLEGMARLATAPDTMQEALLRAARLLGRAATLREALGASLPPNEFAENERIVIAVRDALGEPAWTAAYAEGQMLTMEQAVDLALGIRDQ
jgi:predicted ATPase/class 3 adenylate cyclase